MRTATVTTKKVLTFFDVTIHSAVPLKLNIAIVCINNTLNKFVSIARWGMIVGNNICGNIDKQVCNICIDCTIIFRTSSRLRANYFCNLELNVVIQTQQIFHRIPGNGNMCIITSVRWRQGFTQIRSVLVSWCSFSIIGSSFSWVRKGQM